MREGRHPEGIMIGYEEREMGQTVGNQDHGAG